MVPLTLPKDLSMSSATRRGFLAAAATLPAWFLDECRAEPDPKEPKSPNDMPGIALVGCGGMGRGDVKSASRFGKVVALCDLDEDQSTRAAAAWPDAAK